MKLLNVGCGGNRPVKEPWINIDNLHAIFPDVTKPERINMDKEFNYLNADLRNGIPFENDSIDGILASHFLEHLDAQESLKFLRECLRVLKPSGILRLSVPDPAKFYKLTIEGCTDWGEPNNSGMSFMEMALFFNEHKQLVGIDALNCMLYTVGFKTWYETTSNATQLAPLADIDNRAVFSLFVEAVK